MTEVDAISWSRSGQSPASTSASVMDQHPDDQQQGPPPPFDWASDVSISTTNENWRGKNDPAERRRIQNRLNQRAFRQRQRAGEQPKTYKRRSPTRRSPGEGSSAVPFDREDRDEDSRSLSSRGDDGEDDEGRASSRGSNDGHSPGDEGGVRLYPAPTSDPVAVPSQVPVRSSPSRFEAVPGPAVDTASRRVWDELAQIINRNLMAAAATNIQALGMQIDDLRNGNHVLTPRPASSHSIPASLVPVELQHCVPHDPLIDAIPHARFRFNILFAIAAHRLDPATFCASLRGSGSLQESHGVWQRDGLVVWDAPHLAQSWELSAPFVRQWQHLLRGCEDLIAVTNAWRTSRGERPFPLDTTGTSQTEDLSTSLRGGGGSESGSEEERRSGEGSDEEKAVGARASRAT